MFLLLSAAWATCESDVATLDGHLDRWAADAASGRFGVSGLPGLVVRPLGEADPGPREGVSMVVQRDQFLVDGLRVEPEWMVVAIQRNRNITWGMQRRDPRFLNVTLAVAPDAPWSGVVEAVDAVRLAHLDRVLFLFETPPEVEAGLAPPPSRLHDALAALDQAPTGERIPQALGLVRDAIGTCSTVGPVFAGGAGQFPENRPKYYAEKLAPAVASCGCAADAQALAEAFWYLDGRDRVYAVAVTLTARTLVALPPSTPWAEAWPKVLAARDGAQLGFPTP